MNSNYHIANKVDFFWLSFYIRVSTDIEGLKKAGGDELNLPKKSKNLMGQMRSRIQSSF